jgi:adenylosuccinate synthase
MSSAAVIGVQWGDEGKGRIVDHLAPGFDRVVRFQGGANAGHTIQVGDETYKLHLLPAGILHGDLQAVIGNGVLVDLDVLFREMDELSARGVPFEGRLVVSDRAQLLMPYHKVLDGLREDAAGEAGIHIGTTRRGIGPCQADKVSYHGIRVCDLADFDAVEERVRGEIRLKNRVIQGVHGAEPLDANEVVDRLRGQAERLAPFVADTVTLLHEALAAGERNLYEGAQAALLDVDFGTYPFVTATNASTAGLWTGTGVPPGHVSRIVGVLKAYQTRVGEGPFPTEGDEAEAAHLRDRGGEWGTTTGRPRRCGWLDMVAARYATMVNGLTEIAITKLDVLSGLESIRVAVAYEIDGEIVERFPASPAALFRARPRWREFEGWSEDLGDARAFEDLPAAARAYVEAVESIAGVLVNLVSVGPERDQLVVRREG